MSAQSRQSRSAQLEPRDSRVTHSPQMAAQSKRVWLHPAISACPLGRQHW